MKKKRKNSKQFNRKFKKRFFTRKSVTVLLAAVIVMIAVGFGCNQQRKKAAAYQNTIDELNEEIKDLEDGNQNLEEEKDNIDTDEFKEKMARERLGMIGKDEYSLEESDGQSEPAPEEGTSEEQKEEPDSDTESTKTKSAAEDDENN
ncbi:MAG: septum formation initiator family protein [Lachnospiraceae bacterium]|nr:septum formation initiator family protein [Lachnospiraceae bacterium]